MFCGPETVDVSRGEAEGNIGSRGSTKHTAFPRSQSMSILLYTECQQRRKVPQINQTCIKRITFYLTLLREALWICYLPVNKSDVHRLATLPETVEFLHYHVIRS